MNTISSHTKGDIDHERRLVVARLINESISKIDNKHVRCFEGAIINKRFGLMKPYISFRGVSFCNGSYSGDGCDFEFGAAQMTFNVSTSCRVDHFAARWIDFMFIHHIPFSHLKDLIIIADNKVFSYRACSIEIKDYD